MKLSLWSFISGLLWGVSSGIGLMLWVLLKLLRFQRKDLERRHAWLRWGLKYRNMRPQSLPDLAREWQWGDLDEECQCLLAAVDGELTGLGEPGMSQAELGVAIRSLLEHREEGNARFVILQAVRAVQRQRRNLPLDSASCGGGGGGGASSDPRHLPAAPPAAAASAGTEEQKAPHAPLHYRGVGRGSSAAVHAITRGA